MTDMGQHFNAWREKRARERLARMEAKAAEEDSLPEDEAYENIDEETVSIQPKKKAANIIIPSRKKENVKSKDPAPASSSEPVLQTYTQSIIPEKGQSFNTGFCLYRESVSGRV